ncbi:MAG TPA: hypothetical protein VGK17_02110 [Propionicimonas sp.]
MTLYVPIHRSQYATGNSLVTRHSGCTWTSGCNGVDAISGGRKRPTPDLIHALVPNAQETNPTTPGWSMPDLVRAMSLYGVGFANRSGDGWAAVLAWLKAGHYVVLQGDSDQFGNATCSGSFDGDHAIGVHPNNRTVDGQREWWINDPICPAGRWEREAVLQRYAVKLAASVYFGVFSQPVPSVPVRWRFAMRPLVATPTRPRRFYVYTVTAGKITGRTLDSTLGFTAACTAPKAYPWVGVHSPTRLVKLTSGSRRGLWVDARWAEEIA